MRIQHNIAALNTSAALSKNQKSSQSNLSKLSSGYGINKAADNASGLAISEKMRGQIRGLTQASKNATDGINLINTAEGYMSTANDILQRMRELAVQSANGTYDNKENSTSSATGDRAKINEEIQQLTDELDRLGDTANFNGMKLNKQEFKFQIGADTGEKYGSNGAANLGDDNDGGALVVQGANNNVISVKIGGFDSKSLKVNAGDPTVVTDKATLEATAKTNLDNAISAYEAAKTALDGTTFKADHTVDSPGSIIKDGSKAKELVDKIASALSYNDGENDVSFEATVGENGKGFETGTDVSKLQNIVSQINNAITEAGSSGTAKVTINSIEYTIDKSKQAEINTAANALSDAQAKVDSTNANVTSATAAYTAATQLQGEDATHVKGIDLTTQDNANASIDIINKAISTLTSERARLGAAQNRLEYTVDNLSTAIQNTTASESAIRDTDMVSEMMDFTKNNVLNQAATAMMAQANSQTQSVLQLLQ